MLSELFPFGIEGTDKEKDYKHSRILEGVFGVKLLYVIEYTSVVDTPPVEFNFEVTGATDEPPPCIITP